MNAISLSKHATERMQQRGVRLSDVDLILHCASEIGDDVYFLSRNDAEREIRRRKIEIQALERLCGLKLVVAGDTAVTCYRSTRRDQNRTLRKGRETV
mgnify:CR=1 FL=1|jgi:hypothetical protein